MAYSEKPEKQEWEANENRGVIREQTVLGAALRLLGERAP